MTAGRQSISKTKDWCTPPKYVKTIKEMFCGQIELDPCSNKTSIVDAEVEFILPDKDGLAERWGYKTIFVNPPYGSDPQRGTTIKNWFAKMAEANEKYGSEVIALVPVATNTAHWKNYVYPKAAAICFLYDTRVKFFIDGKEDTKGAPMSCCIIYYGNRAEKFQELFSVHGATVLLEKIKMPGRYEIKTLELTYA